jgi:hypothetical protein
LISNVKMPMSKAKLHRSSLGSKAVSATQHAIVSTNLYFSSKETTIHLRLRTT